MADLDWDFNVGLDDTETRIKELKQSGFEALILENATSQLRQELRKRKPDISLDASRLAVAQEKEFRKVFDESFWSKWETWLSVQMELFSFGEPFPGISPDAWESYRDDEVKAKQYCIGWGAFLATNDVLVKVELATIPVEVLEAWLSLGKPMPRNKSRSSLYVGRNIEPRPNHAAVSDLLRILPYPHKWQEYGLELAGSAQVPHSKDRYVQYDLFQTDSDGELIPLSDEARKSAVSAFDWLDHKILSVLLMRTLESGGEEFVLSLNWMADLISDERHKYKDPDTGKEKYLNRASLLQDLTRRLRRLCMLFVQAKWHEGEGKKRVFYNLLAREGIKRIEFALFQIRYLKEEVIDGKLDVMAVVLPGVWTEFFCNELRQFTWIPKELFELDVNNNWRRYAIGQYLLIEYKINVANLSSVIHNGKNVLVLHRKIATVIEEVLTPNEIEYALSERRKGHKLKNGILEDFEFYRSIGCYVDTQYATGGFDEFMAGDLFFSPPEDAAELIISSLNSRPQPSYFEQSRAESKPKSRGKSKAKSKSALPPASLSLTTPTGEQIKAARKAKGFTQMELVTALGAYMDISQRKLSFWESGKSQPTPKEIEKLKLVLDL